MKELTSEDLQFVIKNLSKKPVAITCSGSFVLPFIKEKRDIDYIFFFDTKDDNERYHLYEELQMLRRQLLLKGYKSDELCFLSRDIIRSYNWFDGIGFLGENTLTPWAYLDYYQKIIYGSKTKKDLLGKDRKVYIESLKKAFKIIQEETAYVLCTKFYYYILVGYYIIKNNSFTDFTSEQLEKINIMHDTSHLGKYKQIIEELSQNLSNLE